MFCIKSTQSREISFVGGGIMPDSVYYWPNVEESLLAMSGVPYNVPGDRIQICCMDGKPLTRLSHIKSMIFKLQPPNFVMCLSRGQVRAGDVEDDGRN